MKCSLYTHVLCVNKCISQLLHSYSGVDRVYQISPPGVSTLPTWRESWYTWQPFFAAPLSWDHKLNSHVLIISKAQDLCLFSCTIWSVCLTNSFMLVPQKVKSVSTVLPFHYWEHSDIHNLCEWTPTCVNLSIGLSGIIGVSEIISYFIKKLLVLSMCFIVGVIQRVFKSGKVVPGMSFTPVKVWADTYSKWTHLNVSPQG